MNVSQQMYEDWKAGKEVSEYNNFRFSPNKIELGIKWIKERMPALNWDNPQNISDRIAHYKYEDMNPLKVSWSDKIAVYDKLYDLGLEDLHIPMLNDDILYKPSDKQIDYALDIASKNDCIIKCNHGSGWNLAFHKNDVINREYVKMKLKHWLELNYAYISGYEWQYEPIVPGLLIQPLVMDKPIDWQFYCENGEIVCIDLQKKHAKSYVEHLAATDENGKMLPWFTGHKPVMDNLPTSYMTIVERMKPYVKEIAKQFKFVRVDLFWTGEFVKFCEATFTPCSGILDYVER